MRNSPYKPSQTLLYRGAVERMAKEMANPHFNWSNPTDPIIVNKQGVILQGHHRIAAAQLAGVQIPKDAIKVVDIPDGRDPRPWQSVTVREGERPLQR